MITYKKIHMKDPDIIEVDHVDTIKLEEGRMYSALKANLLIEVRSGGNLAYRAFWLTEEFDWILGSDEVGQMVLVPLVREA